MPASLPDCCDPEVVVVVMEAAVVTELEISTASVVASVTASEPKSWVMHVLEVPVLEIESMTRPLITMQLS